jgi:membrane-associated phospholipid phosphatase
VNPLDDEVGQWVAENRLAWLDPLVLAVTQLGSSVLLIPLLLAVGLTLGVRRHTWSPLALLASALLGAIALYTAGKAFTGRVRPQFDPLVVEQTFSFPSGHSTQAAAAWLALAAVAVAWLPPARDIRRRRRLVWAGAVAVAVAVGFSRVYLGVHWLTDVLAGLALGAGWTLLLVRLVGRDLGPPRPAPRIPAESTPDGTPTPPG